MDKQFFDLNVSFADRYNRVVIAVSLLALSAYMNVLPIWFSLVAIYPMLTAIVAWDPIHATFSFIAQRVRSSIKPKAKFLLSS